LERLVFSLGLIPVQEWIAQARRSRDLRAGSVFLWYTMARVLARLEQPDFAAEIWLPRPPRGWTFQKLAALPFSQALDDCPLTLVWAARPVASELSDAEMERLG
jgi:hypothetical protein